MIKAYEAEDQTSPGYLTIIYADGEREAREKAAAEMKTRTEDVNVYIIPAVKTF